MSFHSVFNKQNYETNCGIPMMEFGTNKAPKLDSKSLTAAGDIDFDNLGLDIIDEGIIYFRANVLFKSFAVVDPPDRLLVYITVFIQKCLEAANNSDPAKAKSNMKALVDDCEYVPTMKNSFMNNIVTPVSGEVPALQAYLKTVRKEIVVRMTFLLFECENTKIDFKYWIGLGKKKFLGYDMISKKDAK